MPRKSKSSLAQIELQIQRLQREADALKARESKDVIERIRTAIAHYGLTADDLFGAKRGRKAKAATSPAAGSAAAGTRRASKVKGKKVAVKYRDNAGNTWTGRGSRPRWLTAALASGKRIEDFAI